MQVNTGRIDKAMIERLSAPKGRTRPELVATRVTPEQKEMIVAMARREGCTVTDLVYHLVVPAVMEASE